MAEIKSTLDLVMEKTKNLSLSSEERQAQKSKEIESRIRGLLQKFKDQALSADKFKSEYFSWISFVSFSPEDVNSAVKVVLVISFTKPFLDFRAS